MTKLEEISAAAADAVSAVEALIAAQQSAGDLEAATDAALVGFKAIADKARNATPAPVNPDLPG